MGDFLSVTESLLRLKDEAPLSALYKILQRDDLSDEELALLVNERAFAKLAKIISRVDKDDEMKLGLHLKISMLACLIIRRACFQNVPGQQLARKVKLVQLVESIVRKTLSAANDHDSIEPENSQYKAAFLAFSETLLAMTINPPNQENVRLVTPFSEYYLHHLVNWQVPKSWLLLDRLVEVYRASVSLEPNICPLKRSKVFEKMLKDEIKLQSEPSTLDFQLLYRRFQVISLFPDSLDDVENETKEPLMRRFLCLLDNTRDYDCYRYAVFSFARKIIPHLLPRATQQICKLIPESYVSDQADTLADTSRETEDEDEETQLELISSISSLLWTSIDGADKKKLAVSPPVLPQEKPSVSEAEPPTKKQCDCYKKMLQPPYSDVFIKNGKRILMDHLSK